MSEQLEKNSGTFLPIAICVVFIALFVVGAVQSSIPSTAAATPVEAAPLEAAVDGEAGDPAALPAPVADDDDQILEDETFEENGEMDVETVAYVEGAMADRSESSEPLFSQC